MSRRTTSAGGAVCLAGIAGVYGYHQWAAKRSAEQLAARTRGFSFEDYLRKYLVARERNRRMGVRP